MINSVQFLGDCLEGGEDVAGVGGDVAEVGDGAGDGGCGDEAEDADHCEAAVVDLG